MPRALDIVREVALLETYALPLERADALTKARHVPRLLPISVAAITRSHAIARRRRKS
jgi:hypothetical protein